MKRVVTAFLLAWAIGVPPLKAQTPPTHSDAPFTCLFERVTAEQRALAGPAASQRLTDAPADGEQRGGAALDAILASLSRCAAVGRWTENQREMAQVYVLARLAREEMRRHYAAQNVDLSFIDEALATIEPGSPPASPAVPTTVDAMVERVRAQGVTGQRPDSAEDIVFIYMQLIIQAAEMRRGFADPNFQPR